MNVREPAERRRSCGMELRLHRSGDGGGNAFPVSSSSCSSCSSSGPGESSPESLRSLSSLSGGRSHSPLEYDLLEVAMTTREETEDVVLTQWRPEEGAELHPDGEEEEEDSSAGRFLTDVSASVYLDASGGDLTLSLDGFQGNEDGTSRSCGRRSSSPAVSDMTEVPADDDDDDEEEGEESLFVSVSSDVCTAPSAVDPGGSAAGSGLRSDEDDEDAVGSEPPHGAPDAPPASQNLGEPPQNSGAPAPIGPPGAGGTSGAEPRRDPDPARTGTPQQQDGTAPDAGRRAAPRREEVRGPVRVARILRPGRGNAARTGRSGRAENISSSGGGPEEEPTSKAAAEERRRAPSKRVSSRPPGRGTGTPGTKSPEDCRPGAADGSGAQNQNQNQGISKLRAPGGAHSPAASLPKATSSQQSASGSSWRPAAPPASKLPVKGSLSSSSLGSNETNAAAAAKGSKPDEAPSRGPASSGGAPRPQASGGRSRAPSRTSAGQRSPAAAPPPRLPPAAKPPLQRNGSARLGRPNASVDKNKPQEAPTRPAGHQNQQNQQNQQLLPAETVPDVLNANGPSAPAPPAPSPDGSRTRTGPRSSPKRGPRPHHASRPGAAAPAGSVPAKQNHQNQNHQNQNHQNQAVVQLRRLLVQGNRKVEALATVIQHLFSQREETLKQKKELSSELARLREELAASTRSCQSLQTEKEEQRADLEEALRRQEEQHQEELVELENRLKSFYQAEWDKVHQLYQEEADRRHLLMERQVEELRSRQEAERRRQEESHGRRMEEARLEHDHALRELRSSQQADLEDLQRTLKETEASLAEKIQALSAENEDLSEKLRAEEERRQRILSDKSLKDSHTLYLQQELESLKVVLEMKNVQLHSRDKKLMEMDRLVETNDRLEECLKKVQQENEDYRARMDKHAALSKQLSTEQAILQQTLQKESKVNKRLSMENEELLWKLHNGDLLGSPRRPSPTSPCGSPRDSAPFLGAAPPSPR